MKAIARNSTAVETEQYYSEGERGYLSLFPQLLDSEIDAVAEDLASARTTLKALLTVSTRR